jgi:putative methionine-R-sulfoxide reductase with GAF domain
MHRMACGESRMDPHSILDKASAEVPPRTEPLEHEWPGTAGAAEPAQGEVRFPGEDGGKSLAGMAERDLTATLQLLAERAQYITGATGAAIALLDHEEMVCRASAGPSAPEVGAQLQVNSGLSGESVRTQQTLRCDDAFTDDRVNRESCEALGIRSVVVMPLILGNAVIGVFELFSDKANIFETRDITALERMGAMVHTALEHSAAALGVTPQTGEATQPAGAIGEVTRVEEEPAQALPADAGPRGAHQAMPEPSAFEEVQVPEVAGPAAVGQPIGRFEALAASKMSPRSGIAFHMKMPSQANATSAAGAAAAAAAGIPAFEVPAPQPPPADPEIATLAVASVSPIAANEETDILEMPPEVETVSPPVSETVPAEEILAGEDELTLPASEVTAPRPVPEPAMAEPPIAAAVTVAPEEPPPPVVASRGAIANLRKCEACGFPVSEGRQLCLDCEKKKGRETATVAKTTASSAPGASSSPAQTSTLPAPTNIAGEMPRFLGGEAEEASWLSTHKFMVVAIVVAAVGIVVVLVVR